MKKLIAIASSSLAIGFAVAIANAEDTSSRSSSTTIHQQAGSTGSKGQGPSDTIDSAPDHSDSAVAPSAGTAANGSDSWKTTKSCVDKAGTTFFRGQKGFNDCQSWARKQSRDQMGGTVGEPVNPQTNERGEIQSGNDVNSGAGTTMDGSEPMQKGSAG